MNMIEICSLLDVKFDPPTKNLIINHRLVCFVQTTKYEVGSLKLGIMGIRVFSGENDSPLELVVLSFQTNPNCHWEKRLPGK